MKRVAKIEYTTQKAMGRKIVTVQEWCLMCIEKDDPIEEKDVKWYLLSHTYHQYVDLISWKEISMENTRPLYVTYSDQPYIDPSEDGTVDFTGIEIQFPTELRLDVEHVREVCRVLYAGSGSTWIFGWSSIEEPEEN